MATRRATKAVGGKKSTPAIQPIAKESSESRSLGVIREGIQTSDDFLKLSGAMLSDLVEGKMTTDVGNCMSQVARNMLSMLKMKLMFEKPTPQSASGQPLRLCG